MNRKFRVPLKLDALRIITPILTALLVGAAFLVFVNSQRVAHTASVRSQQAVAAHTETLQEIQSAVNQLKANNKNAHDSTITYIQCVVTALTEPGQTSASANLAFKACLSDSGIVEATK